ncbi:MAG TPA: hypothetical protein VFU69_16945 [Ktedonobacterales bacterium]|nr:hypothetical protein [Ktedonobacterales bacterium]
MKRSPPEEQAFLAEDLQRWLAKPEWERRLYAQWARELADEPEGTGSRETTGMVYTDEEFDAHLEASADSAGKGSTRADV